MPLSEHEQRELEQIERYLAAEDPKFVNSIRNITPRSRYRRRIALGSVGFFVGIALLLAGVAYNTIPLGIVGFALMFLGSAWVVLSWKHIHDSPTPDEPDVVSLREARKEQKRRRSRPGRGESRPERSRPQRTRPAPGERSGFMGRIEARWRRRRDNPWF